MDAKRGKHDSKNKWLACGVGVSVKEHRIVCLFFSHYITKTQRVSQPGFDEQTKTLLEPETVRPSSRAVAVSINTKIVLILSCLPWCVIPPQEMITLAPCAAPTIQRISSGHQSGIGMGLGLGGLQINLHGKRSRSGDKSRRRAVACTHF
mmetsp:Transcript_18867/g.21706  ORF Transcript_18867/g.21706 Transcript_18867/m.21706 type:complete len:150 (+) Transcript_18867:1047-1496(+)